MLDLLRIDPQVLWLALALLFAAVLGALVLAWGRRWIDRGERRARARAGQRAERDAERLLARAGYRVVERQITQRWTLWIDGEPIEVTCRADLIVSRGRERLIAEVKGRGPATDPTNPSTRRQLLEYVLAFDVDGALLVDMAGKRVLRVDFPNR